MITSSLILFLACSLLSHAAYAAADANISIYPITNADSPYFSDPFVVPAQDAKNVRIAGTTQKFLECTDFLQPQCAIAHTIKFTNGTLEKAADDGGAKICSPAGVHPFQTEIGNASTWHAVLTLHVQKKGECVSGYLGVECHCTCESEVRISNDGWHADGICGR